MMVNIFNEMISKRTGGPRTYSKTIIRELKKKKARVVINQMSDRADITHFNFYGPKALLKIKATSKPTIGSTHYTKEEFFETFRGGKITSMAMWRIVEHMYRRMDALISPSHYTKSLVRKYGIKKPTAVITNGIEPAKFRFDKKGRERFRKEFGIGDDDRVVYSVGYCIPRKGILAMLQLARKMKDYKFVWVGGFFKGSKDKAKIQRLIRNAPPNFIHTGFVKRIRDAHSAGDIFLFPSYEENQGIVILEAAATGNPVILRDIPVYDGWLKTNYNCIKCSNMKQFMGAIERISNKGTRRKLVSNGKRLAKEHDISKNIKYLKKAYMLTVNREFDELEDLSSYS
ncbi:MAG: glycosyltransferase family 4 protein [Candidatus Aenigmatarchaeota archaeon]